MLERKVKVYMAKSQTIEQSFEKLDEILKSLEPPDISLDEASRIYNEGIKLVKNCNQQLDKVEKQIIVLSDKEGGYDEL